MYVIERLELVPWGKGAGRSTFNEVELFLKDRRSRVYMQLSSRREGVKGAG